MSAEQMSTADIVEVSEEENTDWQRPETASEAVESEPVSLLTDAEIDELQSRWNSIQIEFVDEPRKSVEQADALVADVIKRIEQIFSEKRALLDEQRDNGEDVSTEDRRIALQRYRTFFNHLLEL